MRLGDLIDFISPSISSIPWIERYAGLVQKMQKSDGTNTYTYPVACNVINPPCSTKGDFEALVPDSSVQSIVYWEELSSVTFSPLIMKGKPVNGWGLAKTKARIVVWANLKTLGVSGCHLPLSCCLELERKLRINQEVAMPGNSQLALLVVMPYRIAPKDINQIFGHYSYKKTRNYYLAPYDYFAIDVDISLRYCIKDVIEFVPQPPINC